MSTNAIQIQGLSVSYGTKRALANVFLEMEAGHLYGVIGPNGAGKSTLFKAILGLVEPASGSVSVLGQAIEKVRREMVYLPQKSEVDWHFPATVMDITLMGRYPYKGIFERINRHDRQLAEAALDEVGMSDFRARQIGELSGGQQQRVFLARALCQNASIILLDEPFVGVDATTEEKIIQILKQLAADGKTILVVHHDLSTVPDYFDRVVLLNQVLVGFGDTAAVFNQENIARTYGGQSAILHQTGLVGRENPKRK